MDNVAIAHADLGDVTTGMEHEAYVQAAQETWLAIGLPDRAERVKRRFSS